MRAASEFQLICPECGAALGEPIDAVRHCSREGHAWNIEAGIWRLQSAADRAANQPFLDQYERLREAEGWGSDDAEFYRALPFEDRSGRHPEVWRIRAQSYHYLERRMVGPMMRTRGGELRVVDAGAGNGWLSYRLACSGHRVAAVDVNADKHDGLGALARYAEPGSILTIQSGFDHLPLADRQADMLVFNGSIHYSTSLRETLSEALRVLLPGGSVVVMDTPYYRADSDGEQMLDEQRRAMRSAGGDDKWFSGIGFLTPARLKQIAVDLGLDARLIRPPAAWRAAVATIKARLLRRRARAAFPLIALSRKRA